MKKKILIGVVVFIILIGIIGAIGGSKPTKVENQQTTNPGNEKAQQAQASTQETEFRIGDQVKLGKATLTVNSVDYSNGGQYTKPQEGNEWVNLNLTIENDGSSQQYVTTLGQMFLSDSEKNSYQVAVTDKVMANVNNSLDGSILPKTKRTGWVGFEIKKDVTGLTFHYNASLWGGGTITVKLDR